MLRPFPSSMRAAATTPAEPLGACVARFPTGGSLPRFRGGSASALRVSGPARRSLTLRPAWSLSRPWRPVASACFRRCRYLHHPLRLLPAGATVAGRDSHPLRNGAFSRRTRKTTLRTLIHITFPAYKARLDALVLVRARERGLPARQAKPCGQDARAPRKGVAIHKHPPETTICHLGGDEIGKLNRVRILRCGREVSCASQTRDFGKTTVSRSFNRERRAFRGRRHDLVRELDAGGLHVRIDERRPETGLWRGVRHRHGESRRQTATPYRLPLPRQLPTLLQ